MDEEKKKAQLRAAAPMLHFGYSMSAFLNLKGLHQTERLLLFHLGYNEDPRGGKTKPKSHSQETIAKKYGLTSTTVRKYFRMLEERGYVSIVEKQGTKNSQLSNEYAILPRLFEDFRDQWIEEQLAESRKIQKPQGSPKQVTPPSSYRGHSSPPPQGNRGGPLSI